ncbi:hypothetical protein C6990_05875 [Nitrosopumilus sp. b3]|uniref:hypothetical protein n=1 Tax=Nitrosopumilus sp. b3 TaxID=2109909 RepID=UPI0015F69AA8|nr:hypothetical protein [Nitrosopumilus sp. b3]KAF6247200.1 hypothetical protein C6990_05875 [Nitrosopumilus sp. b3]
MKILFSVPLVLLFVILPAYGQALSDATGLVNRLDIQTGGHTFEIETISNFNILDFDFDPDEKRLSLFINSGLENNLGEVLIPQTLLGGNFTFYLNEQQYFPKINSNEKISFITLNFTGSGENKLEIFGTTYLQGLEEKDTVTQNEIPSIQKEETISDSLGLVMLVGVVIVAAALIAVKLKKRK